MNPLDWHPEAWSALAAWATVAIAVVAARFGYHQVLEARSTREAQAQPFIVVTLEPAPESSSHILLLRVENIGHTLARDVRFEFTPPLHSVLAERQPSYSLTGSSLLTDGIPSMPPGMRIERIFDNVVDWNHDDIQHPLAYDVHVTFADHRGKLQEPLEYRVDLNPYRSGHYIVSHGLDDISKDIRQIRDIFKKWGEGNQGLRVWTRSGKKRDQKERRRYEAWRTRRDEHRAAPVPAPEDAPTLAEE